MLVLLLNFKVSYSCGILCNQRNRTPDSHIGQIRSPIPAKHTVGLTDISKACQCKDAFIERQFLVLFLDVGMNLAAGNAQNVLARKECIRYVEFIRNVHIIRMSDMFSVKLNIAKRIQPLKSKKMRMCILFKVKAFFKNIIVMCQCKRLEFVITVIRVFHQPRIEQKRIQRTGNRSFAIKSVARHSPFSAKRQCFHKNLQAYLLLTFILYYDKIQLSMDYIPFYLYYMTERKFNGFYRIRNRLSA